MTPKISLAEIDIQPIMAAVNIGRIPVADIPGLINEAIADPDQANMYMRLFYILLTLGQRESALDMQAKALAARSIFRLKGPVKPGIRLLAFMGPGDLINNIPLEFIVDNSDIRLDLLFLSPDQALPEIIPDHDVAIVALSESGKNRPLLARVEELSAIWPRPILNRPQHISRCARDTACRLLSDIPELKIAPTQRVCREQIRTSGFPIIIRPVDTHAGKGLAKLDAASDLETYLAVQPESEFFVAEYIDYRSRDGLFRKYRIALIDGRPYLCHLAISENWMVHYHSAEMGTSRQKRDEEAAVMQSFAGDFASRHARALDAIAERLGLDYVILDCGEMPDGRLLFFEADIAGWIHATDPVDTFPYKPEHMQKAFDAFRQLLVKQSGSHCQIQRLRPLPASRGK